MAQCFCYTTTGVTSSHSLADAAAAGSLQLGWPCPHCGLGGRAAFSSMPEVPNRPRSSAITSCMDTPCRAESTGWTGGFLGSGGSIPPSLPGGSKLKDGGKGGRCFGSAHMLQQALSMLVWRGGHTNSPIPCGTPCCRPPAH